jgi:hypothetical protein
MIRVSSHLVKSEPGEMARAMWNEELLFISPASPFTFTKFRELRENSALGLRLRYGNVDPDVLRFRRTFHSFP